MATPGTDDKMIRINMSDQTVRIEQYPVEWQLLGRARVVGTDFITRMRSRM